MIRSVPMASRRGFLRRWAGMVAAPILIGRAVGQSRRSGADYFVAPFAVQLVKEIKDAFLFAVSPDGKYMSLYFTRRLHETFVYRAGQWNKASGMAGQKDEVLRVIEMGSWRTAYSIQLRATAFLSSFFPDRERLYAGTLGFRNGDQYTHQQVIADLRTGELSERLRDGLFEAINGQMLLGAVSSTPYGDDVLILVKLPDYEEVARVPARVGDDRYKFRTDLMLSSMGATFAYTLDNTIVCRRTEDLSVIWTRQVHPEFLTVWKLAFSARSGRIAAAAVDLRSPSETTGFFVGIYDANDGTPVTSLPVNGFDGLAISPDGRLLAVGKRVPDSRTRDLHLVVYIYDIASGQELASELHDSVPPGRFQVLDGSFSHFGIQFTPDGKYLVTSGYKRTKVWAL